MKKILFTIDSLKCGGAEKSLVTLLNSLDYNKINVDLLLFYKGGEFEKYVPSQVRVEHLNIFNNINPIRSFLLRTKYWILRKIDLQKSFHPAQLFWRSFESIIKVKTDSYDIVIAYGQGFPTYFIANRIPNASVKYSWLNTDLNKSGYNPRFDYQMYSKLNKVIAVSEESKIALQGHMASINKKLNVSVIRDISDPELIHQMAKEKVMLPTDSPIKVTKILTVCRLEKVKGLTLGIEAAGILKNKNIPFVWYVVGEGSQRTELEKLVAQNNLEKHFILLGFKDNPYPLMRASDIYVQTSYFEGLGLTVIEASILRIPIVTTNFPTAYSIISDKQTGLICEMNGKSIVDSILKYINDEEFTLEVVHNLTQKQDNSKEDSLRKFYELIGTYND